MPQDISLFHRSVYENIAYGRPEASRDEVLVAARDARCTDFIEAMPEGFDTIVGDRGVKLSGGQRQRIAMRAPILKNSPILLLDEATSALDSASEEAIQKALDRLMVGRTVIAIAHRLSTLHNFDRIIVMSTGKVIDDGSPEELRNRPGLYRDLLAKQYGKTTTLHVGGKNSTSITWRDSRRPVASTGRARRAIKMPLRSFRSGIFVCVARPAVRIGRAADRANLPPKFPPKSPPARPPDARLRRLRLRFRFALQIAHEVVAPHRYVVLTQLHHHVPMPRLPLGKRHRQRRGERIGHVVDIDRIHDQRAGQFLRRTRETRQHQHAGILGVLRGHIFLCDQIHPVAQRCHIADVRGTKQRGQHGPLVLSWI